MTGGPEPFDDLDARPQEPLVSANCVRVGERAAVPSSRPSPDLSPWTPQENAAGKQGTGPVSSISPNSCMGVRARTSKEGSGSMPQETRIVGLDVAKSKVDACIRSMDLRLSAPSTQDGEAWLRANRVGRAVMEASGGYERAWAQALRAAGFEVLVVDPKRVRHFAKAAGRLAKNDPIDAETIARFAEAFPDGGAQPHDPAREEIARLVQARTALKDVEERIKQQREHRPPAIVIEALTAIAKTLRTELRKLEASIASRIKANPAFARRAEIIDSFPGLAGQRPSFAIMGRVSLRPEGVGDGMEEVGDVCCDLLRERAPTTAAVTAGWCRVNCSAVAGTSRRPILVDTGNWLRGRPQELADPALGETVPVVRRGVERPNPRRPGRLLMRLPLAVRIR